MKASVCCGLVLSALPQLVAAEEAGRPPSGVVPLTTRFVLNGTLLELGTEGVLSAGLLFGGNREAVPQGDMTFALSRSLSEGVNGLLFHRHQAGWYAQLRNTLSEQVITTTQREAVNLTGSRTYLTVTGRCLDSADPDAFCTYTPGVNVDESDVDPDTLLPDDFAFDSEFGDVIDQQTHAALMEDGFQRGISGSDEVVGLALDLPNSGFTYSRGRAGLNSIDRREDTESRVIPSLSRLDQNLFSNDQGASLDRTVRSVVLLDEKDWDGKVLALQALAWLLPATDGRLKQGREAPDLGISNNLFYASNNTRLPLNSFTAYHSSLSWVAHTEVAPKTASETPVAWSNSLWMGFSPVRDVEQSVKTRFEPTGPRQTLYSSFSQGGSSEELTGQITIVDALTEELTQIQLANVQDLFIQTGSDVTTQDAIRQITLEERHKFRHVPHLSFSGNRTSGTSVLRYYAGVLFTEEANGYVGADYALNTTSGWSAYLSADFYSDPDRDYYSNLKARLSKTSTLSSGAKLSFGISGVAELDRPDLDGTTPQRGDGDNLTDIFAAYRSSDLNLTMRRRFSGISTAHETSSTTFGLEIPMSPRVAMNLEVTPQSNEDAYTLAQAGFSWKVMDTPNAPKLRVQWSKIKYNYGIDGVGQPLGTSEDTVLAALQMSF